MTAARSDIRAVHASLRRAQDAQITRVVAMVDALPQRGPADDLIAPLRPRLAQLRPARPFGFKRLLFTPLDPVIVPVAAWRSGTPAVPRTILVPLGRALIAALGDDPDGSGYSTLDRDTILVAGTAVWPRAAAMLATLPLPAGWTERSGLPPAEYPMLRDIIAAVLADATTLERTAQCRSPPEDAWIRAVLHRAAARGPVPLATMMAILLARLPDAAQVLAIASGCQRQSWDQAVTQTLARLEAELQATAHPPDAAQAAMEAARVAALLDGLDQRADTARKRQLDRIRRDADTLCRRQFDTALASTMAQTNDALTAAHDDATILALEASARDLRRLEAAGRRLGSGDHFDSQLRQAAAALGAGDSALGLADRVRLVEILAGAEAATALLA